MTVRITSSEYNGQQASIVVYAATGDTRPYTDATSINLGTQTLPYTYSSTDALEYGTFAVTINSNQAPCIGEASTPPDGDGNTYRIIKIGTQTWMSENLKTTKLLNGTNLDNTTQVDDLTWSGATGSTTKYWAYVNGSSGNTADYGLLYNQFAVTGSTSEATSSTNLCPSGWRVPTNDDFSTLVTSLGGGSTGGNEGKFPGADYWSQTTSSVTNSKGFSAVGSGYRNQNGTYISFKNNSVFWTTLNRRYYIFYASSPDIFPGNIDSRLGATVRCLKN